jgi:hypothetical protein
MTTDLMIRELRRLEEKHKDDIVPTFSNNWSLMCHDVANRLEELLLENEQLKRDKDFLLDEYRE